MNAKTNIAAVGRQIILTLIAVVFASGFLACSGYDPLAVVKGLARSVSGDIAGTVRWATPLILSGLAICVTYKAEVFNLGVDGQLYIGASAATAAALMTPFQSAPLNVTCVFLAAMLAGAMFALIPALLRIYLNANEVVSTLLLNFIAELFVDYLVTGPLRDVSVGANLNASAMLPENTWLPRLAYLGPSAANAGIYIALIAAAVLTFIFFKTTVGHEIKIVGANPTLASYAGIKPKSTIIRVMLLSGAIAGIVGAVEVTAVQHRLLAKFNPGFGFDGIVVSLLGGNNPIGVLFSGFFFGALTNGGINMERMTDVPAAVSDIVMAIIIITISAKFALPHVRRWFRNKREAQVK